MSLDLMDGDEGTVEWKSQALMLKTGRGKWAWSRHEGDDTTFIPFRNERDQLGRLLSDKPRAKPKPLLNLRVNETYQSAALDSPKAVNRLKLVRKSPSLVPPVGTYQTSASWIKKSFRSPKAESYFSAFPTPVQSPKSSKSPATFPQKSAFVSKHLASKNLKQIPVKKSLRSEDLKPEVRSLAQKNGFATLALIGNPSELRTNLSFHDQVAQRNASMARFKTLYQAVASLSKLIIPE